MVCFISLSSAGFPVNFREVWWCPVSESILSHLTLDVWTSLWKLGEADADFPYVSTFRDRLASLPPTDWYCISYISEDVIG